VVEWRAGTRHVLTYSAIVWSARVPERNRRGDMRLSGDKIRAGADDVRFTAVGSNMGRAKGRHAFLSAKDRLRSVYRR
jgi:hypothetical protein